MITSHGKFEPHQLMIQPLWHEYKRVLVWIYEFRIRGTNQNLNQTSTKHYQRRAILQALALSPTVYPLTSQVVLFHWTKWIMCRLRTFRENYITSLAALINPLVSTSCYNGVTIWWKNVYHVHFHFVKHSGKPKYRESGRLLDVLNM